MTPSITISVLRRRSRDDGFSLIELLIVIFIIGVLTAIAVPLFLNMQQQGYRAATETDVHHLAVEIESQRVENGGVFVIPEQSEVLVSPGVTIHLLVDEDAGTYYLQASHQSLGGGGTYYYYGSASGGVIGWDDDPQSAPNIPSPLDATNVATYSNVG